MYYFPVSFPLRRSPNLFTWLLHSFLHSTFAEPCIGCVQITGHRPVSKTQIQSKFPILREHRGAGVTGLHTDGHNQVKTALEEAKDEILQGRTGVASTLDSGGQQRRVFRACLLLPSTCIQVVPTLEGPDQLSSKKDLWSTLAFLLLNYRGISGPSMSEIRMFYVPRKELCAVV